MSSNINSKVKPPVTPKAVHGGKVSATGAVTGATEGFTVQRQATAAQGFILSWPKPIDGGYVVDADINIEGLYRVPTADKTPTSCRFIMSTHAGTEVFNNFAVAVREL